LTESEAAVANRHTWRRADVALAGLITLATLATWLTLFLTGTGLESALALFVTVCRRTLEETLAHSGELGRLSLLLPLGLGLVLSLGEALRLMFATRRWMAFVRRIQGDAPKRLRHLALKSGLDQGIILIRTNRPLVFTHGLLHPQVWISTGLLELLDEDELEAVLLHEAHHVSARDPLKILAARCLSRALFFVPVARDLCETYLISKELAADEHATQALDDAVPLVRALRKLLLTQPVLVPEAVVVGKLEVTESRLLSLLNRKQPLALFDLSRLGVSLVLLAVFLAIALAPAAGHLPSLSECAPTSPQAMGQM